MLPDDPFDQVPGAGLHRPWEVVTTSKVCACAWIAKKPSGGRCQEAAPRGLKEAPFVRRPQVSTHRRRLASSGSPISRRAGDSPSTIRDDGGWIYRIRG